MALTWSAFKNLTRELLSGSEASDALYVEAAAQWVIASARRELGGDLDGSREHQKLYRQSRRMLAGYNHTGNDAAIQTAVKVRLAEGPRTNEAVTRYTVEYVKAYLARELEHDIALHDSFMKSADARRMRLLGFNTTLNLADLETAVKLWIPIDATRANTDTIITAAVALAKQEVEAIGPYVDSLILQGIADIEAFKTFVDELIRLAVIDLQTSFPVYRTGQETVYEYADVALDGYANRLALPDAATLRKAWLVYYDEDADECGRCDLNWVPFEDAHERLILNDTCEPLFSAEPAGGLVYVTPQLEDTKTKIALKWDGIRLSYSDGDTTTLDEPEARAVAAFVNWQISLKPPHNDLAREGPRLEVEYRRMKRKLWAEQQERMTALA